MQRLSWVAALLVSATLGWTPFAHADGAEIVVTGSGSVVVSPNRATIDVLVTSTAGTTKDAMEQSAQKVNGLIDSVSQLGISDTYVETAAFAVRAEIDPKKGKPTGRYICSHRIRVRMTNPHDVGPIVDRLVAGGAELISITFAATEIDCARRQALTEAVAQAHADAQAMAEAAGGTLGPLIQLTTQGSARPPELEVRALKTGIIQTQTTITPVDQYVNVTVLGRWEFRETD
jgi:hypothetical protein